jgi:hypothetical protein
MSKNLNSNKRESDVDDNIGGSTPKVLYAAIQKKIHIEDSVPSNSAALDRKKKRQKLKKDGKNDTSNPPEVIKVNDNRDDTEEEGDDEEGEEKEKTSPQIQFGDLPTTSVALEEALEREENLSWYTLGRCSTNVHRPEPWSL